MDKKTITVELKNGLRKTVTPRIADIYLSYGARIIDDKRKPHELGKKTNKPAEVTKAKKLKEVPPVITKPADDPLADEKKEVKKPVAKKTTKRKTTRKRTTKKKTT